MLLVDLRVGQVHLGLPRSWSGGTRYRRFQKVNTHGFHVFLGTSHQGRCRFFDKSEVFVYVANTVMS